MDLSWPALAFVALTICGAYIVYGLTGFGSTIVAMPLLAQVLPLRVAVPMMLVFDISAGLLLGWKNHSRVHWGELLRMLPWLALGLGAGVALLVQAPERLLLALLGASVLAYASWSLVQSRAPEPVSGRWAVPTGFIGGVFSALYGVGGVVYSTYLLRRLPDKTVLRASVGMLVFGSALARVPLFAGSGLYQQPGLLQLGFALLPCALVGYWLGSHLHSRLPAQRVVQAVWLLLLLGGASLLLRALFSTP